LQEYEKKTLGSKKTVILVEFLASFLQDTIHAFLNINK